MSETIRSRIGFISPSSATSAHFDNFKAFIPGDVQMDFHGLGLVGSSLYDLRGATEHILRSASDLATERRWHGVIVSGAPVALLNPGLLERLQAAVQVPVTTALTSCPAALRAFLAKRVLLMTPFDESMNQMIRDYLANCGIEAVSPSQTFRHFTDAAKLTPEDVYSLTKKVLEKSKGIQAIYFQGARGLDPLMVLHRIEQELHTTVVASNPAMLWFILSKIGLSYRIRGYGKLLEQWPKLPE